MKLYRKGEKSCSPCVGEPHPDLPQQTGEGVREGRFAKRPYGCRRANGLWFDRLRANGFGTLSVSGGQLLRSVYR